MCNEKKINIQPVPDKSLVESSRIADTLTALCQVTCQWVWIFHGEAQQFHSEWVEIRPWKVARPIPYLRMFPRL